MLAGYSLLSSYRVLARYRVLTRYGEPMLSVTVPVEEEQRMLDSLEASGLVDWIEPDFDLPGYVAPPSPTTSTSQVLSWAINDMEAFDTEFKSGDGANYKGTPNASIFVLDSGADSPDLDVASCVQYSRAETTLVPCLSTMDAFGHGTAVAGVAAAKDNKLGTVGIAPGAPVHMVRVMNAAGYVKESVVLMGIDHVMAYKEANPTRPVVMNMSLGAYVGSTQFTAIDDAVKAAIGMGITVVVSAGNDGNDASLYSPAHVPEAITVGAYGANRYVAAFSNKGAMVDLYAPGVDVAVVAAGPTGTTTYRESGTSMAAPHVAGAAALVLTMYPQYTPKQVRDFLVSKSKTLNTSNTRGVYVKNLGKPVSTSGSSG